MTASADALDVLVVDLADRTAPATELPTRHVRAAALGLLIALVLLAAVLVLGLLLASALFGYGGLG